MKFSTKKLHLILWGIVISFGGWFIFLRGDLNTITSGWELRTAIYSIVLIIYYILVWKIMKFKIVSPRFFILLSMILFHIALVIVVGFNLHEYDQYTMLYRYGEQNSCNALFFANIIIFSYVIGLILFNKNNINDISNINLKIDNDIQYKLSRIIGIILFSISIGPTLYSNIYQIVLKVQLGYKDGVWGSSTTLFGIPLGWFLKLFLPSILLIIASYKENKKKCKIICILATLYYVSFMFLTGRKGNTIQTLCPIILIYFIYFKPKIKLNLIIIGYLGIWIINIVTKSRDLIIDSTFINKVIDIALNTNPIVDLMYEMGGTIKAVIQMQMAVPETGHYLWGLTYPAGVLTSILDGINLEIFDIRRYADFSVYLSLPERGGLLNSSVFAMGGSCIAEWWWNFGWFSIIVAIFFAWIIIKYENNIFNKINDPINLSIMCSILYYILRYTRGYIIDTIWDPLFIVIIINILRIFLLRKYKRKFTHNIKISNSKY